MIIWQAIEILGAERVIFETDTPWAPLEIELRKIKVMRLPEEKEELVLGGNMARIPGINTD